MKTLEQYFADWESHVFGFGYGTGEQYIMPALKRLFDNVSIEGTYDYCELEAACGSDVAWLLLNTLHHADIFEYGSSTRFAWLTNEGKALKAFIDMYSINELIEFTDHAEDYITCYPNACNCGPDGYEEGRICQNPFWPHK